MNKFALNPDLKINRVEIGNGQFYLLVDDFLHHPHAAVQYAIDHIDKFELMRSGYPGMLLRPEDSRMAEIYGFVRRQVGRPLGFYRGGVNLTTFFSLTTLQPEQLNWAQRMCHTDPRTEEGHKNVAGLVYLFDDPELGGTGFFKFRNREILTHATVIGETDMQGALAYLREHLQMYREPPCYLTESNDVAELLATVPARFNRAIFYSGDIPHNAMIAAPQLLSNNPQSGRLTMNLFASVLPK